MIGEKVVVVDQIVRVELVTWKKYAYYSIQGTTCLRNYRSATNQAPQKKIFALLFLYEDRKQMLPDDSYLLLFPPTSAPI